MQAAGVVMREVLFDLSQVKIDLFKSFLTSTLLYCVSLVPPSGGKPQTIMTHSNLHPFFDP